MVKVDSMVFGEIKVDGKTYYSDIVLWWDGRVELRPKSHEFTIDEFVHLLKRSPESVVIGTGTDGVMEIAEEVMQVAEDKKIKVFVDKSPNAAEVFNGQAMQGKKVVAVLHATC